MPAVRSLLLLALLIFPSIIFAQTVEEAAKEKQRRQTEFLEQVLGDAKNLRLPENRAFVFVKVGNALWQTDEKRARQLLQSAVNDLIAAQTEAETEKGNKQLLSNLSYGQSPRWEILYAIASCDAEFALDAMMKTRPPKLVQALELSKDKSKNNTQSQSRQFAVAENQNEQRLMAMAAEQNPQRAVKLLHESLKKGATYETINLLKKVVEKGEEEAADLAEEVGQKLLDAPLDEENQDSSLIQYFLSEFAKPKTPEEKSVKISDALSRSLSEKIVKFLLGTENSFYFDEGVLKIVEKFFPTAVGQIKQKQSKLQNQNMSEQDKNYYKLMQEDVSAEELLSQVEKFPRYQRNDIYQRAAEKTAQNGNVAQARDILSNNLSDEEADRYLSQFNYNIANKLASEGKFTEANALLNQIVDEELKLPALINLAGTIYQKNPKENQNQAAAVLEQARALIPDLPEKMTEINALLSIASGYAEIDSARAFNLTETVVPLLNEYTDAAAVLSKFNDTYNFRHGEYQINAGNNPMGAYSLPYVLQRLKSVDFERAVQITKGINRLDARLSTQLQLIDSDFNLPVRGGGEAVISVTEKIKR